MTNSPAPRTEADMREATRKLGASALVEALAAADSAGLDEAALAVYRRVLITAIEERMPIIASTVELWFERIPVDQGVSQEEYAAFVVRNARAHIAG